jgi:hypothetical protein
MFQVTLNSLLGQNSQWQRVDEIDVDSSEKWQLFEHYIAHTNLHTHMYAHIFSFLSNDKNQCSVPGEPSFSEINLTRRII